VLSPLAAAQKAVAFIEEQDRVLGGRFLKGSGNILLRITEPLAQKG
jgi:hypothetical protein